MMPRCNRERFDAFDSDDSDYEDFLNMSTSQKLTIAIEFKKEEWVRSILASLDKQFDIRKGGFVCEAVEAGNPAILQALLDAGADPNERDLNCERHAVHICASTGNLRAFQVLVDNGADINKRDSSCRTPLHWVAMYGTHSLIKWMAENGALPNPTQKDGFTPLHTASCLGYDKVCKLLITEGGADITRTDKEGWSPLIMAVCYGYSEVVKVLASLGADMKEKTAQDETALHVACSKGNAKMVELLLELGVPIESKDGYEGTPLHYAVTFGHMHVVYVLLRAGATVRLQLLPPCPFDASALLEDGEVLEVLLTTGCVVPPPVHRMLKARADIQTDVLEEASRFPSLLRLCMLALRKELAPSLQQKAQHLPIPQVLKDALTLKDLTVPALSLSDQLMYSGMHPMKPLDP